MANLMHSLPFLIPIIIIELGLTIAALVHIFTHKTYRFGNRVLWVIVSFVQIIGPIVYFIFGRSDE
ncbi:PLD nuclease N-terminal domain-containing protein [Bacillus sp. EB600]|uniref:PLD nuclease N-terminal domain-containing protein n=1 Tax=Bacillus sp. EB600 TaxID=2806345 RepID=UPI00210A8289|nr:PLD nuclease N-terminal domain-containing protein [Bacillus sp. EB600]MCQ6279296.1 PLDc_N domain-containing protein [Bacillus sp. EB600]